MLRVDGSARERSWRWSQPDWVRPAWQDSEALWFREERGHSVAQIGGLERLHHESADTCPPCLDPIFVGSRGRDEEDGNLAPGVRPDLLGNLDPAQSRHPEIRDDEVEDLPLMQINGSPAVGDRDP